MALQLFPCTPMAAVLGAMDKSASNAGCPALQNSHSRLLKLPGMGKGTVLSSAGLFGVGKGRQD